MSGPLRCFVATRAEDAPCRHYVSVDGRVPGALLAWDHHVTGEPTNLDALPAMVDLGAVADAAGVSRVEGVGTTWADADAVLSAVVVVAGGTSRLAPGLVAVMRAASHWCDHLGPSPLVDEAANRAGERLARWIAFALRPQSARRFEPVVRELVAVVEAGGELPGADPDPAVAPLLKRIIDDGRLHLLPGGAWVDLRDLPPLPPLEVHGLHDRPFSVFVHRHASGGRRYVVGVNPTAAHPEDLAPALAAVAAAEFAHGPPARSAVPGPDAENWGGRAAAFGSPWNYGSRLTPEEVAALVAGALG
jgi:hypothetical protein